MACAALCGAACEIRTDVGITVDPDGSGEVAVAVTLDDEAVAQNPDLLAELELADLEAAGWEVRGPVSQEDGSTRITIRHDFGAPGEVGTLIDEIAGDDGPFRDFSLVRDDAFAETEYRFQGAVDFTSGAEALTEDPALAEALGAQPAGLIEDELGGDIEDVLAFRVALRLPGEVESNAPTETSDSAVWNPSVADGERVELSASSTVERGERIVWLVASAGAGAAAVLVVAIRVVRWQRARRPGHRADPRGS